MTPAAKRALGGALTRTLTRTLTRALRSPLRKLVRWRWLAVAIVLLGAAAAGPWWLARRVPLPARLAAAPSTIVEFADGSPAFVFLAPDDRYRMAVSPQEIGWGEVARREVGRSEGIEAEDRAAAPPGLPGIDPDYIAALLRFEDKRFLRHGGVDPLAVLRSLWLNLRYRRPVSGASTISLQLVRVLEPRPRRLRSKVVEALRAVQLEMRLSKREIFAAYLTFIPFGRNLEGVRAASWSYFGHGPEELSGDEIATLLAVPQRPTSRHPSPEHRDDLRRARDEIAGWLIERDALPRGREDSRLSGAQLLRQIRASDPPLHIRPMPRWAPHFAYWLRTREPARLRFATTLDRGLQRLLEQRMRAAGKGMSALGIDHGAAVLVDHRTSELRALVGSFDFWQQRPGAQIAGFDVARSPGSALKPFIYALALDRGLALPEHLVLDLPVSYGDYSPENYDGDFVGLIALEEALSHSLNVPFVRLLGRLGVEPFLASLRAAGVVSLRDEPGYYGLSAAIGSVEVTPLEVAGLYAALARGGGFLPLRFLREEGGVVVPALALAAAPEAAKQRRFLTEGASFLTRRALARKDRPDFPQRRRLSGAPRSIHWKTGTSYGHRDAWAAGSGPDTTAVVWLGNFDQRSAFDLVGAEAAGPLLFDLLEAAADRGSGALAGRRSWRFPRDLKTVEVCAYSGHLPTAACPTKRRALALRHHVPTDRCPYHTLRDVDRKTGLALNPSCRGGRDWESRSFLVWPDRLRRYHAQEQKWWQRPPPLDPECRAPSSGRLAFLSPPAGQVLFLIPGIPASEQEVPFEVESHGHASELSWFVDGRFVGVTAGDERFWWTPEPGDHQVMAVAESGDRAAQRIEVRAQRGRETPLSTTRF